MQYYAVRAYTFGASFSEFEQGTRLERDTRARSGTVEPVSDDDRRQQPAAAGLNVEDLLVRLWRATAPDDQLDQRRSEKAARLYLESGPNRLSPTALFDSEYYASQLPWFVREETNLLEHYFKVGWTIGLSPHIAFDSAHLARQLGIQSWTEPPLLVFFEHELELSAHPLFDVDIYRRYIDLSGSGCARLFELFVGSWDSARAPFSSLFSLYFYGKFEPIVRDGNVNPLLHYLSTDPARRRDPNPMVHNRWYDLNYPAGRGQSSDPLIRFASCGIEDGHLPNPFAARELRLRDAGTKIPREMLAKYIEVSSVDADWHATDAFADTDGRRQAVPADGINGTAARTVAKDASDVGASSQPAAAARAGWQRRVH